MRKVYNFGVPQNTWSLIDDLHTNSYSAVKWRGAMSHLFEITRGVKQGGLLSADLYKVYVDDLLRILQDSNIGRIIGSTLLNAAACADDIVLFSNNPSELPILISIAWQYSRQHRYLLQPLKSVVTPRLISSRSESLSYIWKMGEETMPIVDKSTHLGIIRGRTVEKLNLKLLNRIFLKQGELFIV